MSIDLFWKRVAGVAFTLAGVAAIAFTAITFIKVVGFLAIAGGLITLAFSRD